MPTRLHAMAGAQPAVSYPNVAHCYQATHHKSLQGNAVPPAPDAPHLFQDCLLGGDRVSVSSAFSFGCISSQLLKAAPQS